MKKIPLSLELKYYGPHDLGVLAHASAVCNFLDHFRPEAAYSCNEILGLENCLKYLADARFLNALPKEKGQTYTAKAKEIRQLIGRYWRDAKSSNIEAKLNAVEMCFHDDLVDSLTRYKVLKRLSSEELFNILRRNKVSLLTMLENKQLVKFLDSELHEALVGDALVGAECVAEAKFLMSCSRKLFLPASLTNAEIDGIMSAYADERNANCNYLLAVAQAGTETKISDQTKLKARRRYDREIEALSDDQKVGIDFKTKVEFSESQDTPLEVTWRNDECFYSVGTKYLDRHLDYEEILLHTVNIFGVTDCGILTLPSYAAELGVVEQHLLCKGGRTYLAGVAFTMKQHHLHCLISMYDKYLASRQIQIEEAIRWFFAEYLAARYGAPSFSFVPSTSQTYYEKAKNIFAEMDGVMRQFRMYVQDGKIDDELLEISSESFVFDDCPSLSRQKYVYINPTSQDMQKIMFWVFSDQAGMNYTNVGVQAKSLASLLAEHKLTTEDFCDYQKSAINQLLTLGILAKSEGGILSFVDESTLAILNLLHEVEAVVYAGCSGEVKRRLDEMLEKRWLIYGGTLLTRNEADYFDFYLNHRKFTNGPGLRNKYLHGAKSRIQDEAEHKANYVQGLILMLVLVVKVWGDFEGRSDLG